MSTSGPELLIAAWRLLDADEREAAYQAISELRLAEQAGGESETARMIRSLRRIAEHLDGEPSADEYRRAYRDLSDGGEELVAMHELIAHFGTWRRAKEALALSDTSTARRIDARFRYRALGKVWRYTEEVLRETLMACAAALDGRAPTVAEFDWWRQRELEKAAARREQLHLPSPSPYRKRWGSWEAALEYFGFESEQITARFQQT